MADKVSIAIRQRVALERLKVAATVLGARYGVPAVDLDVTGRDPALVRAIQLEALADLLAALERVTVPGPKAEDTEHKMALPGVPEVPGRIVVDGVRVEDGAPAGQGRPRSRGR